MDTNEGRRLAFTQYDALYTAEITNGYLTLPMECLKDMNSGLLIITFSWEQGIVCLFTPESFDEAKSNIDRLNFMDSAARAVRRRVIGSAKDVNIINETSIHIDPEFLDDLGLDTSLEGKDKEPFSVVILKHINRISIASSALFEKCKEA